MDNLQRSRPAVNEPLLPTTACRGGAQRTLAVLERWLELVGIPVRRFEQMAGVDQGYFSRVGSGRRRARRRGLHLLQKAADTRWDCILGALLDAIGEASEAGVREARRELLVRLKACGVTWPAFAGHSDVSADHLRSIASGRKAASDGAFLGIVGAGIRLLRVPRPVILDNTNSPRTPLIPAYPDLSGPISSPTFRCDTLALSWWPTDPAAAYEALRDRHPSWTRPSRKPSPLRSFRLGQTQATPSVYGQLRRLGTGVVVLSHPYATFWNAAPIRIQLSAGATLPPSLLAPLGWPAGQLTVARVDFCVDLPLSPGCLQPLSVSKRTVETIICDGETSTRLRVGGKGPSELAARPGEKWQMGLSEALGARGGAAFYRTYDKAAERRVPGTLSRIEVELRPRCPLVDLPAKLRTPFGDLVLVRPLAPDCEAPAWVVAADMLRRVVGSAAVKEALGSKSFGRFVEALHKYGTPVLSRPLRELFDEQRDTLLEEVYRRVGVRHGLPAHVAGVARGEEDQRASAERREDRGARTEAEHAAEKAGDTGLAQGLPAQRLSEPEAAQDVAADGASPEQRKAERRAAAIARYCRRRAATIEARLARRLTWPGGPSNSSTEPPRLPSRSPRASASVCHVSGDLAASGQGTGGRSVVEGPAAAPRGGW